MRKIQRYGWRKDSLDPRDKLFAPRLAGSLPDHVDWSSNLPAPYDQGQLGSCTANAIAGAIQFLQMRQHEELVMPSRLFIYYNERELEGTTATDSGAEIRDGIKTVNQKGYCPESAWPYDIKSFALQPYSNCYKSAVKKELLEYQRVDNTRLGDLLTAISQGPVVGGFTVFAPFESNQVAKTGIVGLPKRGQQIVGGHAILVVGYDMKSKRLKVRNSWGIKWGMAGYFTVPFAYFTNGDWASNFWLCTRIT